MGRFYDDPIKDSTYFTITNAGMSVQNAKDISWGPFITTDTPDRTLDSSYSTKLDNADLSDITPVLGLSANATIEVMGKGIQWLIIDGGTKYIIQVETNDLGVYKGASITVPANQFSMTLDNDKVTMKLVNFSYPYSADYNVSVTYEESWTLGLKQVNGQNIFWFTQVSPPKMTTTVTQTKEALTREVIEGAIAGVLVILTTIAPIVSALRATAEVSEITNEANQIEKALIEIDSDASEVETLTKQFQDTQQKLEAAVAEFQSQGRLTRIGNALGAPKWKAIAGICGLTGLLAITDIAADKIISAFAANDPQKHLPNFDAFAEFCIAPYSWPGVSGFDLVSANLANSLVIGLKAKQTS